MMVDGLYILEIAMPDLLDVLDLENVLIPDRLNILLIADVWVEGGVQKWPVYGSWPGIRQAQGVWF